MSWGWGVGVCLWEGAAGSCSVSGLELFKKMSGWTITLMGPGEQEESGIIQVP